MSRLFATAACATALVFAATAPAFAQWQREARVVTFGDLDLDSPEGADVLIRRIRMAADVVCGDRPGPQGIAERYSVRGCEIQTTEYAVNDVGHPMVIGRYYGYIPEVIIEDSWHADDGPSYEVKPQY